MSKKDDKRKQKRREKRKRAQVRDTIKRQNRMRANLGLHSQPRVPWAKLNDLNAPIVPINPKITAQVGEGLTVQIPVDQIKQGPLRHERLEPQALATVSAIYEVMGNFIPGGETGTQTLQEWEDGFLRDMHPEREIAIWARICLAWRKYHELYLGGIVRKRNYEIRLVGALIGISMGNEDLPVPPNVAIRLAECYKNPSLETPSLGSNLSMEQGDGQKV